MPPNSLLVLYPDLSLLSEFLSVFAVLVADFMVFWALPYIEAALEMLPFRIDTSRTCPLPLGGFKTN